MTADLATITGIDAPTGLLIGGRWGPGRGGTLPVLDPATEDVIAQVASATPEGAVDGVAAAHDALPGWAARPPRERGECLRRAFELMIDRTEALARRVCATNPISLQSQPKKSLSPASRSCRCSHSSSARMKEKEGLHRSVSVTITA